MRGNTLAWGIGGQGRLQGLQEVHAVRRHRRRRELRPRGDEPRAPPGARAGAGSRAAAASPPSRRSPRSGSGWCPSATSRRSRTTAAARPRSGGSDPCHVTSGLSCQPVPPRRHQAVPQGDEVPHREVPGRASCLSRRASTARPVDARGRKASEYAKQLREKQKVKRIYGAHREPVPQHVRGRHRRAGRQGHQPARRAREPARQRRLSDGLRGQPQGRAPAHPRTATSKSNGHRVDVPSYRVLPGQEVRVAAGQPGTGVGQARAGSRAPRPAGVAGSPSTTRRPPAG